MDRIIQTALAKRPGLETTTLALGARRRHRGAAGSLPLCRTESRVRARSYFFSPLTSALKSAPGRNFGTEDFGT
jgi:hypothetical protein